LHRNAKVAVVGQGVQLRGGCKVTKAVSAIHLPLVSVRGTRAGSAALTMRVSENGMNTDLRDLCKSFWGKSQTLRPKPTLLLEREGSKGPVRQQMGTICCLLHRRSASAVYAFTFFLPALTHPFGDHG
jgi:hypothetical protein